MISRRFFNQRLADEQDKILAACGFPEAVKGRLKFTPMAYKKKSSPPILAAAALAMLTAAAALVSVTLLPPAELTLEINGTDVPTGSWIAAPAEGMKRLDFSDGSRLYLQADTYIRLKQLQPEGAHLLIEQGSLDAAVTHRPNSAWKLDFGPYFVAITGTRFNASWDPESREFQLSMDEGSIRVEGPMIPPGTVLKGGERLLASLDDKRMEISAQSAVAARVDEGLQAPVEAEITPPVFEDDDVEDIDAMFSVSGTKELEEPRAKPQKSPQASARSSWKTLAAKGDYAAAVTEAEAFGLDRILRSASAVELLTLGDAARRTRQLGIADDTYKKVRHRFPGTPHASDAAFSLGKIAFDQRRYYGEAAYWFRTCLTDSPTVFLKREALGRLMESLRMSGDGAGAASTAREYLALYPKGPHAAIARQLANTPPKR